MVGLLLGSVSLLFQRDILAVVFVDVTLLKCSLSGGAQSWDEAEGFGRLSGTAIAHRLLAGSPHFGMELTVPEVNAGVALSLLGGWGRENPKYHWVPSSTFRQLRLGNLTLELYIGSPHSRSDNSWAKVTLETMTAKDGLVLFTLQK